MRGRRKHAAGVVDIGGGDDAGYMLFALLFAEAAACSAMAAAAEHLARSRRNG